MGLSEFNIQILSCTAW